MLAKLQSAGYLPLKVVIIAAPPGLLLFDTGVAVLRGWHGNLLDLLVFVCTTLGLVSLIVFTIIPRGRKLLHKHGLHLSFVILSALVAWLAAEAIVTVYLSHYPVKTLPSSHRRVPWKQWLFRIDSALMPGISGDSRYTTNSLGIRGPEFPPRDAAYRILCIGASTTECTYLDDKETWMHLLMESLNSGDQGHEVWVGGIGISAFSTVYNLKFVEKSPLMREIDCLVLLVGAADFNQFLRGKLVNGKVLRTSNFTAPERPIWRRSSILAMVRDRRDRRIASPIAEDPVGENHRLRRLRRKEARTRDTLPDLEQALREYKARIHLITKLSRSKGVRPVFVAQPTLWSKDLSTHARSLLWFGDTADGSYLSAEAGREGIDKYNETLMATCEEMGVLYIETRSTHGREQYYYDDFHFSEAGARELARLVANGLRRLSLFEGVKF